jgi:hypothetical protein
MANIVVSKSMFRARTVSGGVVDALPYRSAPVAR